MKAANGRMTAVYLLPALVIPLAGCHFETAAADSGQGNEKSPKPVVQVSLATVQRATVEATIPVTGTLVPLSGQEAKVTPLQAGRIRQVLVKTGDHVTKGQVIATLDAGPLLAQIQQAQATVRTNAATLRQAQINLEVQRRSQQASVVQARSNLHSQQVSLQKLEAGSRPQEIAQAHAAVTAAQAAVVNAEQSLNRSQILHSEGLLARKDLEAAQVQHRTATAQLQSAQEALSMAKQGSRPEDIEAGRSAVRQAEEQLRATEGQAVVNDSKAQDVRIAQQQLQGAQAAVKAAQAQLAGLTVRAPLAGTVVGRTANPGESADVAGGIVTIVNLDRVRILLSVPATTIAAVRPGQAVSFTVDGQPGTTRHAVVTVVNRVVDPNTNTVQAEALTANPDGQLRDDSFVRGAIVTATHARAIVVPAGAVVQKDGKPTVFVVGADSVAHAKVIKTGVRDIRQVEVLSGVAMGERVVTTGAYELDDNMQVKVGA